MLFRSDNIFLKSSAKAKSSNLSKNWSVDLSDLPSSKHENNDYLSLEVKINGVYKHTTHWMPFVTGMNDLEAFIKTLRGTLVSGSNLN